MFAKKVKFVKAKNEEHSYQTGGSINNNEESGSLSSTVEKSSQTFRNKVYDKIHRFIKIILKLAQNVGYDEGLRIKLTNGKYLDKSNIVDLLTHAMSVGKVLYGENEFIELLAGSGVSPELIINDNVKSKLLHYLNNRNRPSFQTQTENEEFETIKKPEKLTVNEKMDVSQITQKRPIEMEALEMEKWRLRQDKQAKKRKFNDNVTINSDDDNSDIDETLIDSSRWKLPDDD